MIDQDLLDRAHAMPFARPSYPKPPYRFVNREFVVITYRTDPAALERLVPAPLKIVEPVVKYEFIKMPDSSGLGSYAESGQVIPVTFEGETGGYTHAMYLDNLPAIVAGRELLGFPKSLAQPKLELHSDTLVGTLDHSGVRVATATMAYKYNELDREEARRSLCAPGYLLKIIPDVDGSRRICELVKYRVGDLIVKGAWSGPATLELHPHCFVPVSQLPVREVLSAVHMLTDLSLGDGEVVHDYLQPRRALRSR